MKKTVGASAGVIVAGIAVIAFLQLSRSISKAEEVEPCFDCGDVELKDCSDLYGSYPTADPPLACSGRCDYNYGDDDYDCRAIGSAVFPAMDVMDWNHAPVFTYMFPSPPDGGFMLKPTNSILCKVRNECASKCKWDAAAAQMKCWVEAFPYFIHGGVYCLDDEYELIPCSHGVLP